MIFLWLLTEKDSRFWMTQMQLALLSDRGTHMAEHLV